MNSSTRVEPQNGKLGHDPVKLETLGREERRVSGPDAVTRLLRWKNQLRAYRNYLDEEIATTTREIDKRMDGRARGRNT